MQEKTTIHKVFAVISQEYKIHLFQPVSNLTEYVNDRSAESTTSSFTVNYDQGTYQQFSISSGTTYFTISRWPDSGKLGSIKLEITPNTGSTSTVDFIADTIFVSTSSRVVPASYNQNGIPVIWELWTTDGGTTILGKETNFKSS